MSLSSLPITAATLFVHFKRADNGEKLYATKTVEAEGGGTKEVQIPVGVHVYTPGSKVYRTASNMNTTSNIKAGKKELSGAKLDEQQVELLARTTFKIEGFELEGGVNFESLKKFYDDERFAAYREQVADEQADLGKSLIQSAKG